MKRHDTMNVVGIIPARYGSTRFEGKPLINIKGKSMIQRVYEQTQKTSLPLDVYIATDDKRIYEHVLGFGAKAIMTSTKHKNGTERCLEAILKEHISPKWIINIQGDEPFLHPSQIDTLIQCLTQKNVQIATLYKKSDKETLSDSNTIKIVKDKRNRALYFSRAKIPYQREKQHSPPFYLKHIGIYGYTMAVLKQIVSLPEGILEKSEMLEQLRWLENGYTIHLAETSYESKSIDTPEDLHYVLNHCI